METVTANRRALAIALAESIHNADDASRQMAWSDLAPVIQDIRVERAMDILAWWERQGIIRRTNGTD